MTSTGEKVEVEIREPLWNDAEREAWRLPERMTGSEWAGRYRILDPRTSAEPGRWRNARTPYLRGVMDAFTHVHIEKITLKCSTQVGKTETLLNCLGYVIDQDPGPTLVVKPRKDDARELSQVFVRPMIETTPQLIRHIKGGAQTLIEGFAPIGAHKTMKIPFYELDRMNVFFGEAGSPAALAARAIRYLFRDEVNKYPPWSGKEASPQDLAEERTRTFWNRKIFDTSTPTTRYGNISVAFEESLKHRFFVPCPHCGDYQAFEFQQVKWPKAERDPKRIVRKNLAYYECRYCKGRIEDRDKAKMMLEGVWVAYEYEIVVKGEDGNHHIAGLDGEEPRTPLSNHVGFHLNCIYSPWLTFSEIAAKFLKSKGDPEKMMNFVNSWLAEDWEDQVEATDEDKLRGHIVPHERARLPEWVKVLTAGVDVQKELFYIAVRGWGRGETSILVDEFFIEGSDTDWDELEGRVLGAEFAYENIEYGSLRVALMGVDSGYRTTEVYEFCRTRPWSIATKGETQTAGIYGFSHLDKFPNGKIIPGGLKLMKLNSDMLKEKLHRQIKIAPGQPGHFSLHHDTTEDYISQVCAEHQVRVHSRTRAGHVRGGYKTMWVLKSSGRANHYLDCEVINMALGMYLGVRNVRDDGPGPPKPKAAQTQAQQQRKESWVRGGRRESWMGG